MQGVFSRILNDDVYHADERVAMKSKRVACKLINMQRYNQQFTGKFHTFSQLATYVATHAFYLSYEDADESLGTSDEKIQSSQNITEDNRTKISIDIHILIYSLDL